MSYNYRTTSEQLPTFNHSIQYFTVPFVAEETMQMQFIHLNIVLD